MYAMIGRHELALPLYQKIIQMAPDFYDAWNNMAGIYGGAADYANAHACYLKAHELAPDRPQPLYGLALTSRDLKKYDECLQWCVALEKMTQSTEKTASIRAAVQRAQKLDKRNML